MAERREIRDKGMDYTTIVWALGTCICLMWIGGFVGELVAWRCGYKSITDPYSPLPPAVAIPPTSRWQRYIVATILVPLALIAILLGLVLGSAEE